MPMFCRHNRLVTQCSICRRESDAQRPPSPPRRSAPGSGRSAPERAPRGRPGGSPRAGGLVTRRMARAPDDGYRNTLVPGIKATADAQRLAAALLLAAARLEFPGPYPAVAERDDLEDATWLAFLLALAGPGDPERQAALAAAPPAWAAEADGGLGPQERATALAYRQWAQRAGSQAAAFAGEPGWTPARRFARVFERLSLPDFARAQRYELLVTLGAAGLYELEADALHVGGDEDAATLAAKRLLVSGDRMLLERRARDLARACAVPVAALDRALVLWNDPRVRLAPPAEVPGAMRAALRLP